MMRWLKEKKRGEKKASGGHDDSYKEEDDYGFEKEKPSNKSPVIKRELPPTPAAPEEKSTHIYEEIPDLHVSCTPEPERTSLLKNKKQAKANSKLSNAITKSNQRPSLGSRSEASCLDDSISPYMVVPVDEEVRQTPPHFNRNGTPEVHCDLIVKDTHCEVLLTRKPKVGAFRLDSTALTGSENSAGAASGIRNNTHFCSRNRRASVDVQAGGEGKGASAFSWSSSAFSSASTSKVSSMGRPSISLSTLQEHRQLNRGQLPCSSVAEGDSGSNGSSAKGVMTYSTASNFIPRATKLVFKPLTPLDPEMFDDPDQDIALRTAEMELNGQNAAHTLPVDDSESIEYASVQGQTKADSDSPILYSAIQDQNTPQGRCEPSSPPSQQEIRQCQALSDNPFRSALIRPYSPSSSSSCTYASVSFPPEPRLYNTIQDLDINEAPAGSHVLSPAFPTGREGETILYPGIDGELGNEGVASRSRFTNYNSRGDFINESKFTAGCPTRTDSSQSHQRPNFSIPYSDENGLNRPGLLGGVGTCDGAIYSGIGNPCDLNTDITYSCIDSKDGASATHTTASLLQNKMDGGLVLDFCTCQDYHQYSSCGCVDVKGDDDDNASVATTANEIKASCSGCGRLIRQITYSESYSDETYEHAYSSRLLLRKGRRFSSPDITLSEISNSESQDLRFRQGSPFSAMSRDDMFARSQTCDVQSTFFRPEGDFESSLEHPVVLNGREPRSEPSNARNTGLQPLIHRKSICAFDSSNDPKLKSESINGSGKQYMKRTSLPLNTSSSSSPTIPSDLGLTKTTMASHMQPKSSTFSGLFSKFSKSKVKPVKLEPEGPQHGQQANTKGSNSQDQNADARMKPGSSVNLSPEKNVLKLSKFFQRLSVKDAGCEPQAQSQNCSNLESKTNGTLRVDLENCTQTLSNTPQDECTDSSKRPSHEPDSVIDVASASKTYSIKNKDNINLIPACNSKSNSGNSNSNNKNNHERTNISEVSKKSNGPCLEGTKETRPTTSHQTFSSGERKQTVNSAVEQALPESVTKAKSANKTDSGDTCYEYDISTSSESEHTSYDYFLSKVKKSLNLEKEVQHIADMNALRKRLLCKLCKKGPAPEQCEMCGVDGACSHVPSLKCSDWRKLFGELVVDQRAAILDCLTDFAHSPYTVKGDGLAETGLCRECGGEIMTSDSESLTTVYSLLSQQLRMTSPGAQTPSCDSDEGTMADNSCESGDDEKRECGDGDNSSGFDDDDEARDAVNPYGTDQRHHSNRGNGKPKKREKLGKDKRDKKSHSHSSDRPRRKSRSSLSSLPQDDVQAQPFSASQDENASGLSMESLVSSQPSFSAHKHSRRSSAGGIKNQNHCSGSHSSKSNTLILTSSSSMDNIVLTSSASLKDAGSDTNKDTRAKTSLHVTDKAIQDIYAPLPSKALSWLTARHIAQRNNPCACSRIPPSASMGSLSKSSTDTDVQEKENPGTKELAQHLANLPQENSNIQKGNGEITTTVQGSGWKSEAAIAPFQENTRAKKTTPDLCSTNSGANSQNNIPGSGEASHGSTSSQKLSPGLNLNRRRSRQLPLAALDLLPETAFGSDAVEEEKSEKESTSLISDKTSSKPPRPRLVERMTRLFENNGSAAQSKDSKLTLSVKTTCESQKGRVIGVGEKHSFRKMSDDSNEDKAFNNSPLKSATGTGQTPDLHLLPTTTPARHARSASKSEAEPSPTLKARAATDDQVQAHVTPTGCTMGNSDHLSGVAYRDASPIQNKKSNETSPPKRGSTPSNENKVSNPEFMARQQSAPPSPTCSTSSSSSSISSSSLSRRRGGGQGKQKRLSRKSHLVNKKVKTKASDRKKKKKEEKTYYCFSSDISDIDVVEVEDWSVYPSQRSVSETRRRSHSNSRGNSRTKDNHHGGKELKTRRERSASRGRDSTASTPGIKRKQATARRETRKETGRGKDGEDGEENADDDRLVQEIYAMPPNSSEVCEVKTHRDDASASPTASPELRKLRKKSKRTDIYKTKNKTNNRLLSDLIIRNYDRQVFGNV